MSAIALRLVSIGFVLFAWPGSYPIAIQAEEIRIDFAVKTGEIRPLHGVNGGPLADGETIDLAQQWRELAIPSTRLHDCQWPQAPVVDMHAVFPSLAADPNSPASYDFRKTDDYLQAIVDADSKIVYRLGESIEHSRRKYHVAPPADYEKWSAACLGIIRHYNEGWADGFRHDIRYWEIWNEPENRPAMWTGTDDDYYRLYATAAKTIKAEYPQLKVGGPSVGATGDVVDDRLQPTAFLQGFIRHCKVDKVPLDFFSWHTYTDDPQLYARKAKAIRLWLDEEGFGQTEIHLNEWNYLPGNDWTALTKAGQGLRRQKWYEAQGGPQGAAFLACVLIDLQDSPVEVANFYTGDTNLFGLFNRYGVPKKTFYAMKAFRMLLDTPQRVQVSGDKAGKSAACAGLNADQTEATVAVSNYRAEDDEFELLLNNLPWEGKCQCRVYRVDEKHNLDLVETRELAGSPLRLSLKLTAPGVLAVRLNRR